MRSPQRSLSLRAAMLLAAPLLLSSCATAKFTRTGATYPPYTGTVAVYDDPPTDVKFSNVGYVSAQGGPVLSWSSLISAMQRKSAKYGANAIIIKGRSLEPYTNVLISPQGTMQTAQTTVKHMQAAAIRVLGEKSETERGASEDAAKAEAKPATPPEPKSASGTGFFIAPDGLMVTNKHVVEDAQNLQVKTQNGTFSAKVLRLHPTDDIALVKVEGSGFKTLPIRHSRNLRLGSRVFTIGFPNIVNQGLEPKYTSGEVSSLAGPKDDPDYLQVSVPIQPGNSGGALLDESGNAVGIVTLSLSSRTMLIEKGFVPQNVNYALKASRLIDWLGSVAAYQALVSDLSNYNEPTDGRSREDIIQSAEQATAMILVNWP